MRCDGYAAYYTSGGVTTHGLFSQQYGRFEARIIVGLDEHHSYALLGKAGEPGPGVT